MPISLKNRNIDYGEVLVSWKFPEFVRQERGKKWYVGFFVITFGLLIFALVTASFMFIVVILMFVAIVLLSYRREPQEVEFKIAEDGVIIDQRFYKYSELDKFWIIYDPPIVKTLYLDSKATLSPVMSILLEDQNPIKVREILSENLEEDLSREDELNSDVWQRVLKL